MILKNYANNYEHVKLPNELCEYIETLLHSTKADKESSPVTLYNMLELIMKNTPFEHNPMKNAIGITKYQIAKELKLSKHMCNEMLNVLIGSTLIQYDEMIDRGKYWTLTSRGFQVLLYSKRKHKPISVIKEGT